MFYGGRFSEQERRVCELVSYDTAEANIHDLIGETLKNE